MFDSVAKNLSWYDPAKLAAAQHAQGAGADGRSVLNGASLQSILTNINAGSRTGAGMDTRYTRGQGGDMEAQQVYNGGQYDIGGQSLTAGLSGVFGKGQQGFNGSTEAEWNAYQSDMAQKLGLDPSAQYATGWFDNPTGNAGKDVANVAYRIGPDGQAVPVRSSNDYQAPSWVGDRQGLLATAATLAGGVAAGAAMGAGGAAGVGAGEAAGAGAGSAGLSSADLAALYGAEGYGGAGAGAIGTDAATSAAWGSGAGLGGDTLGAVGGGYGGGASAVEGGAGVFGAGGGGGGGGLSAAQQAYGGLEAGTYGGGTGVGGGASGFTAGGGSGASGGGLGSLFGGGGGSAGGLVPGVSNGQLLSLGGSLVSGIMGSSASKRAAQAQIDSANSANAMQKSIDDRNRADNAPLLETRNNALAGINNLMRNPNSITSDPGYKFGMDQGTNALSNSASAQGNLYSGATLKALDRFGTDYGTTKLNDSYNRLNAVAGLGQVATGSNTQSGTNYANQAGSNITGAGNASASGYVGSANAWGNALSGAANSWNQYNALQKPGG